VRGFRAVNVGMVASGVILAMFVAVPTAQAACGDYGEPPCPVPTATPQPPAPPPPAPRPTPTPTPTPAQTLIPVPTETTNPQNATVLGGGAVIIMSQATAEEASPRLVLQPLGRTINSGQVVEVQRLAPEQIIVQFLQPDTKYVSEILLNGKWTPMGTNSANSKGQLVLPALRGIELGRYPVRVVPQLSKPGVKQARKFFRLSVVKKRTNPNSAVSV